MRRRLTYEERILYILIIMVYIAIFGYIICDVYSIDIIGVLKNFGGNIYGK